MESKSYKKLYNFMLENGELKKVSKKMTGDWEKDKILFIQEQKRIEETAGIIDTDYEQLRD